jgi:hypothetical protein
MPNPGSSIPLRKVTLNLYEEDCAYAERFFGQGWSEIVRDCFHRRVQATRFVKSRTLGDLDE